MRLAPDYGDLTAMPSRSWLPIKTLGYRIKRSRGPSTTLSGHRLMHDIDTVELGALPPRTGLHRREAKPPSTSSEIEQPPKDPRP